MKIVTPYTLNEATRIYDQLVTLQKLTPGTLPLISTAQADLYGWDIAVLREMVSQGALIYCSITDIYHLHPTDPKPPSFFFQAFTGTA